MESCHHVIIPLKSSSETTVSSISSRFCQNGLKGVHNSFISEALRGWLSSSESEFTLRDEWTPVNLAHLDPDGWIFRLLFLSDLGLVTVDTLLLDHNSFGRDSSLPYISSRILVILYLFFFSKIWVHISSSFIIRLCSFNCGSEVHSPLFSWVSWLVLVKVLSLYLESLFESYLLPSQRMAFLTSLDLLFLLLPIFL